VPAPGTDHRLVVPVLAAWSSAAWFLGASGPVGLTAGAVLLAVAGLAAQRSWHRAGMALLAAGAGAVAAGLQVLLAGAGPLPELAAERAVVTADVALTGDPRLVAGAFGEQVIVEATAHTVTGRGRTVDGRAPVLLFAPPSTGLLDVPLGGRVDVVARLAPADSAEHGAWLLVSRLDGASAQPGWWWDAAAGVRAGVDDAVDARGQPGQLLPALVVGDDSGLASAVADDFRAAGLTHLLAVSGTNLTLVLSAVLLAARALGARGRGLVVVGLLGVVGFVLLARPEPSVLRAAAMGVVALVGLTSGDRRRGLRALGVAVLVLLLVDPWLSRSAGFVLSVLATTAIVVVAPGWRDALCRWLPRWAAEALAVPLAAQLACTPVVAAISGNASVVGVLANMLAAPAVGPATVLGLVAGVVAAGWAEAGQLVGWLAVGPAWWIVTVGRVAAGLPGASLEWDTAPASIGVLAGVCLLLAVAARWVLRRRAALLVAIALLVVSVLRPLPTLVPTPGWPPSDWVLVACDVGQGDALVLAAGESTAVLVDVGPASDEIADCLSDLGVERLSAVLLTHLHADHAAGLSGVLDEIPVGELVVGPVRSPPATWAAVEAAAADVSVPVRTTAAGATASAGPLTWQVLSPSMATPAQLSDEGSEGSPVNDASLVLAVDVAGLRLLLTGDIEPPAQAALMRSGADLGADVLKVPHHGSARQDADFLAAVDPALAVICVGADNSYGHPAAALVDTLHDGGADVARTDLDGDVAVLSDGSAPGAELEWAARGPDGGVG